MILDDPDASANDRGVASAFASERIDDEKYSDSEYLQAVGRRHQSLTRAFGVRYNP